jgi:hypothetical protein
VVPQGNRLSLKGAAHRLKIERCFHEKCLLISSTHNKIDVFIK